jgi:hypothetical protein
LGGGGLPAGAGPGLPAGAGPGLPVRRRFASAGPGLPIRGRVACTAAVCLYGGRFASVEHAWRRFASPEAVCQSGGLCQCEGQLPQVVGVAGFSAEPSRLELCFITGYMIYSTLHLEARRWTTHRQKQCRSCIHMLYSQHDLLQTRVVLWRRQRLDSTLLFGLATDPRCARADAKCTNGVSRCRAKWNESPSGALRSCKVFVKVQRLCFKGVYQQHTVGF